MFPEIRHGTVFPLEVAELGPFDQLEFECGSYLKTDFHVVRLI
jgi:hypothetical protein